MSPTNWEADKMLDIYIHDYLRKKKLNTTAATLLAEGRISADPVAIDAPGGFLLEWWSIFWDIFMARPKEKHSKAAASHAEHLDPNHASPLKEGTTTGTPGTPGSEEWGGKPKSMARHFESQIQNRELPDKLGDTNSILNPRGGGSEGLLFQVHGSNQGDSNVTLKGWPLQGLEDPLRSELLQQQKSMMQSPQSLNQLKLQQQLMLQAQHNFASASELESGMMRMLLNNQLIALGKDGQKSFHGDLVPNGPKMQDFLPDLPRGQKNSLTKPEYAQHLLSSQQYLNSDYQPQKGDNLANSCCINADGSIPSAFQGTDQALKSDIGRKRKYPATSLGPASSSGTVNNTGQSPASPLASSIYTTGDVMPIQGSMDDGPLGATVDSFQSPNGLDSRNQADVSVETNQGFTLTEIQPIRASTSKIECCHFSSDGKLLATGGHDRKVVLWCSDSFSIKSTLEEHSQWITDVRFSPSTSRIATSSADKTVRIWNADNPGYSLRTFTGHTTAVASLDFHPSKEDLVCSCDNTSEIRYWSIKNGSCAGVFKGGASHIRFQPHYGRTLAASAENFVSLLDVETQICRLKLQGHEKMIHSICWDPSGEYLASVSEDLVKLWKVGSGGKRECVHELSCSSSSNKFHSSVFHPSNPSLFIIGCHETLELWNMKENKTMTVHAHENLVSGLAAESSSGLVASTSYDKYLKFWK